MFDLKRFRKDNNITQIQVAQWLHCGQSNISMLEKNMSLSEFQISILKEESGIDISKYLIEDTSIELNALFTSNSPNQLLELLKSQQKTIENLSEIIKNLTNK